MNLKNKTFHPKDFEKKRYLNDIKLLAPLKQEKVQQYALIVFTLVALSVFGLFAINPTITTILELRKKLEDSQLVNEKLDKKIADLSTLYTAHSNLSSDLPTIYAAIPVEPDVAKLLGQLQALAQEQNVTIIEMQSLPVPIRQDAKSAKKKEQTPSFEFSLEITGSYDDLQTYLQQLTGFERMVSITSVSITRNSGVETSQLEMTIKGKAYYQHES